MGAISRYSRHHLTLAHFTMASSQKSFACFAPKTNAPRTVAILMALDWNPLESLVLEIGEGSILPATTTSWCKDLPDLWRRTFLDNKLYGFWQKNLFVCVEIPAPKNSPSYPPQISFPWPHCGDVYEQKPLQSFTITHENDRFLDGSSRSTSTHPLPTPYRSIEFFLQKNEETIALHNELKAKLACPASRCHGTTPNTITIHSCSPSPCSMKFLAWNFQTYAVVVGGNQPFKL